MTQKEYEEIIKEMAEYVFSHKYKALNDIDCHKEYMLVIGYQDVIELLNEHVSK